jgi:hypothetical protein
MAKDNRTYNEKLNDRHGIGRGTKTTSHADRTSKDAKHQGPAKKS